MGWLLTLIIAWWFFNTSTAGWLIFDSRHRRILPGLTDGPDLDSAISFMEATGALQIITVFVKTFASGYITSTCFINVGAGNSPASIGYPRFNFASHPHRPGYSSYVAVALPAIGFDALCTFALLAPRS